MLSLWGRPVHRLPADRRPLSRERERERERPLFRVAQCAWVPCAVCRGGLKRASKRLKGP
eukprot:1897469-Alexandrium_andersonii.AAC.1